MYIIESKMDIIAENSPDLQKMVMSVVNQRQNQNSRQTYYTALTQFFNWYSAGDNQGITAEIIREYLIYLENRGKSKSTISTSLSVLRQLFKDLRRLEVIDEKIYNDLLEIKFKKPHLIVEAINNIKSKDIKLYVVGPTPNENYLSQLKELVQKYDLEEEEDTRKD